MCIFFTWTVKKYFVAPDFSLIYVFLIWSSNGIVIFSKSWINKCAKTVTKYSFACISRLLTKFVYIGPSLQFDYQPGAWISHIPTLFSQLVLVFTALNYDLYYQSGAWIWIYLIIGSSSSGSCNSSSNNFFGIDNTIIRMSVLIN